MKIIVTGSLGHISRPLTKALIQQGHVVTVVSSSPERKTAIEALGATAAIGTVNDANFLAASFSGADAVYCMTPPNDDETDQVAYYTRVATHYANALERCGVKRAIYLSSYGAHVEKGTGYITGSHHAENIFNALSGVAVTHIRPGYFYYNLLNFIPAIKYKGVISANYGGNDKLLMVSPKDIAAAIAEDLQTRKEGISVKYVASDDRTCNDVAHVLGNAIGKPGLQWSTVSSQQMQTNLEANGVPAHIAATLTELGAATHAGILREEYDRHPGITGDVKLEDFAQEFAAAYKQT